MWSECLPYPVLAANHCGIETVGISCITNMAAGILMLPLITKSYGTAERVKGDFSKLIKSVVEKMEV